MRSYRPNHERVYKNLFDRYKKKLGEVGLEDSYALLCEVVNDLESRFKAGEVEIEISGGPEEINVEVTSPTFPLGRGYSRRRRYSFSRRRKKDQWSRNVHYVQAVAFLSALEVLLRGKELHVGKFRCVFEEVFPELRGSSVTKGVKRLVEGKLEFIDYDRVSDTARLKEGTKVKVVSKFPKLQKVEILRDLGLEAVIST